MRTQTRRVKYMRTKCENRSVAEGGAFGNSEDPKKDPRDLWLRDVARLEELPSQMKI